MNRYRHLRLKLADERHGRRMPTPRFLQRPLLRLWRLQQGPTLRYLLRHGQPPNLDRLYAEQMVDALGPLVADHYQDGLEETERRLQYLTGRRRGGKGYDAGLHACWLDSLKVWDGQAPLQKSTLPWSRFRAYVRQAAQALTLKFCRETNRTTTLRLRTAQKKLRDELAQGLDEGESIKLLSQRVRAIFHDSDRALTIAQCESSRALHAGQLRGAIDSGIVEGTRWLAGGGPRTCARCLAMNGMVVALGDAFYIDPKGGPYAMVEHPPLHVLCECTVYEVLK